MIPRYRIDFNRRFQPSAHAQLLENIQRRTGMTPAFRISETPCFVPRALMDTMTTAGVELVRQLVDNPDYLRRSTQVIPEPYRAPHESRTPLFVVIDFGLIREPEGDLAPRLVELQGFSSLWGFEELLCEEYQSCHALDPSLSHLLGGHTRESYWERLRQAILGGHAPEHVVLADLHPRAQKTLPDFRVLRERLGVPIVDISQLQREGRRIFYRDGAGRSITVHRIYNRAVPEDLEREQHSLPFDFRDELELEWAGHPNWFFHLSKFSLPFLEHPTVPRAVFLSELEHKRHLLPERQEDWVLKPLYSYAGHGICFGPTDAQLAAIPEAERSHYLLEERVAFAPVIDTPAGATQAEIRLMYVWPEHERAPLPLLSLVRMGRGLMMNVQHNQDQPWVGVSAAFVA